MAEPLLVKSQDDKRLHLSLLSIFLVWYEGSLTPEQTHQSCTTYKVKWMVNESQVCTHGNTGTFSLIPLSQPTGNDDSQPQAEPA